MGGKFKDNGLFYLSIKQGLSPQGQKLYDKLSQQLEETLQNLNHLENYNYGDSQYHRDLHSQLMNVINDVQKLKDFCRIGMDYLYDLSGIDYNGLINYIKEHNIQKSMIFESLSNDYKNLQPKINDFVKKLNSSGFY